ncbi:replication-relaxation family protein [Cytobacillus horneckiae]|uniref:replication-relaxation family protein n=1 Tax=Cytobacillus horneckiae TaxID=549687 RepID=UPI0019CF76B5|nr:replication-relaxation family protein [Cytobacillus horneckiae]MBN6890033.1 replication-relaxation family protein [Cytobacillus horneckiae]
MKTRDKEILNDLMRFRCLTRDNIIDLHFKDLKQPITSCNTVLKRLRRDGHIEANLNTQPFLYFPSPASIKKDSMKIPHFLSIAQFYISLLKFELPKQFIVEPKYGKGFMEPDAFMIWKRAPFFVEIQRSIYSERIMNEKIKRYEEYYLSDKWQFEPWQPVNKKVFPTVLVITENNYNIQSPYIRFIQVSTVSELMKMFFPKKIKTQEIKINSPYIVLK